MKSNTNSIQFNSIFIFEYFLYNKKSRQIDKTSFDEFFGSDFFKFEVKDSLEIVEVMNEEVWQNVVAVNGK